MKSYLSKSLNPSYLTEKEVLLSGGAHKAVYVI